MIRTVGVEEEFLLARSSLKLASAGTRDGLERDVGVALKPQAPFGPDRLVRFDH